MTRRADTCNPPPEHLKVSTSLLSTIYPIYTRGFPPYSAVQYHPPSTPTVPPSHPPKLNNVKHPSLPFPKRRKAIKAKKPCKPPASHLACSAASTGNVAHSTVRDRRVLRLLLSHGLSPVLPKVLYDGTVLYKAESDRCFHPDGQSSFRERSGAGWLVERCLADRVPVWRRRAGWARARGSSC